MSYNHWNRRKRSLVGCCLQENCMWEYCKCLNCSLFPWRNLIKSKSDKRSKITDHYINFKASLSFRRSTSSTRYIVIASLLTNKIISTKQMYINMSDFGKYVKSRKWLKVLNKLGEMIFSGGPIWMILVHYIHTLLAV